MLGLLGMRVLDAEPVGGELEVTVETIDAAAFDRPVRLRWRKRRWSCPERVCPARTWTETYDGIAPRAVLTDRAQKAACRRVGRDGASVARVAREYGVGWHTIMSAVEVHGRPWSTIPTGWQT